MSTRIDELRTIRGETTYRVRVPDARGESGDVVHATPSALTFGVIYCTSCNDEQCPHADAVRQALLRAHERG